MFGTSGERGSEWWLDGLSSKIGMFQSGTEDVFELSPPLPSPLKHHAVVNAMPVAGFLTTSLSARIQSRRSADIKNHLAGCLDDNLGLLERRQ
jgi:hypothetical protein